MTQQHIAGMLSMSLASVHGCSLRQINSPWPCPCQRPWHIIQVIMIIIINVPTPLAQATSQLRSYFYPHQLGIGTPGGCEAAVHSARRYLEALPPDHVMVKLDFSNAFNSIRRREMLLSVYNRVAELYAHCRSAYNQSSCLYFDPYIVLSEEDAQQGDPIGPCYFATRYIHDTSIGS